MTERAIAIEQTLLRFLERFPGGQIVSLGAGFDTSFFRLAEKNANFSAFFEVDFVEVTRRKAAIMMQSPLLLAHVAPSADMITQEDGQLHSPKYHLLGCDLQDCVRLQTALVAAGLDLGAPTLLLSECVLTYVPFERANEVLHRATPMLFLID